MIMSKVSFCVLLILLTTTLCRSKDYEETQEHFLCKLLDPTFELFDEDTVQQLRTNCSVDLIQLKQEVRNLNLSFLNESSSSCTNDIGLETQLLGKNIQKLSACYPQSKQTICNCLSKNNVPLKGVSSDENDDSTSNCPRKKLGCLPQHVSNPPGPVNTVKSYIHIQEPQSQLSIKAGSLTSNGGSPSTDKKTVDYEHIATIAAACTSAMLLVILLCVCCCPCGGSRKVRKYDERPLLSWSRSYSSTGFSPNDSSGNSEIPLSFSSTNAAARPSFDLKLPPGRVGISPLKPPPGKQEILPPEEPPPSSDSTTSTPPPPTPPEPPKTAPKPPLPPPPPGAKKPPPPPPPKSGKGPPRPPPPLGAKGPRPLAIQKKSTDAESDVAADSEGAQKAKLKPFFWDKVQANTDETMVWNQLKAGSFQVDEEMMESLFGYANTDKGNGEAKKRSSSMENAPQFIQIIDAKKAQNLSILLRALNVTTEEVYDALREGNELPPEFIQSLLKMAPTSDEELKLRLFNGNLAQLRPADRFLKALVDIPLAFKRLEALLFMGTIQEELAQTKEAFAVLEVASTELKESRLFLKLLEAVLKTGNRMNDGTFRGGAQAFKLDTLLKLSDVKGVDGKTTLLHFVVKEIIRSEGIRAARTTKESKSFSSVKTEDMLEEVSMESEERYRELGLQVVSRLSSELENVKKAAALDSDALIGTTVKFGHSLLKAKDFLNKEVKELGEDKEGFQLTLESFVENAERAIVSLLEEEKKITALVKSTVDYFHGNTGRDEGFKLFVIVRDFLVILDKVCRQVGEEQKKAAKANPNKQELSKAPSIDSVTRPAPIQKMLLSGLSDRKTDDFSSDDESP